LNLLNRRSRTALTFFAIGVSVAFAILLVSVAVGLDQENNARVDRQTNFWIIPAGSGVLDPVMNSEKTMLGNAHQRMDEIRSFPDVKSVSPVLNKVIYAAKNEPKMVMGIGVIPDSSEIFFQDALAPGDPHFYGNDWTRQVEVNEKLSKLLGVQKGDLIHLSAYPANITNSTHFKIVTIVDSAEFSNAPVVILHLSELQELTGNLKGDRVNQITVIGNDLLPLLQGYFPDAVILSEAQFYAHTLTDDRRILATATAVTVVSFLMGVLFISSAMIFSVNEKQKEFAVMRAIGISNGSIMKIIFYESIMISFSGGAAGVLMAVMGRYILIEVVRRFFDMDLILSSNPLIPLVVFSTAVIAGIISGIWPAISGRKANIASVLGS